MTFPISLSHLTVLHASPPEMITLAATAGYDFVGLRLSRVTPDEHIWPLINDRPLLRATRERMQATGIEVLDVELVRLTETLDVRALEPMLDTAAQLGARHVLTQAHDPVFARVAERYGAFCDLAARYGLTSDIEFLTWTEMSDLHATTDLLEVVDRPNSGVCIDTLHFSRSACEAAEIDALPARWIHFAQIADAPGIVPHTDQGLIRTAREARLLPGEGGLDLAAIIRRLPPGTPLALEIPNAALSQVIPDEQRIRMARDALLGLLEDVERECG